MRPFRTVRVVRTSTSEIYTLWEEDERLGQMDVHYAHDIIHATIILERQSTAEERKALVDQVDEEIVNSYLPDFDREDFLVTIFQGTEVDSFSDGSGELDEEFEENDDGDF